jgi:8-oxo-dGTP pyrophosphatase MutT (NUDIX family)
MARAREIFEDFREEPARGDGVDVKIRVRKSINNLLEETVLPKLKERWHTEDDADAWRCALFAGIADDYLALHGGGEVLSLVKSLAGNSVASVSLQEFLEVTSAVHPLLPQTDHDALTRDFLRICYAKHPASDFALPSPIEGFKANMRGCVRALGWVRSIPYIEPTFIEKDFHAFPLPDGGVVQVVRDDGTGQKELDADRASRFGKAGTGVNDAGVFIWCHLSMKQVNSMPRHELMRELGIVFDPLEGVLQFTKVFAWDDVAIGKLKKAVGDRAIGPMKLSANALVVDRERSALVIQKKRDSDSKNPDLDKKDPYAIFGGGLQHTDPSQNNSYVVGDSGSMLRCVRREVMEEANLPLPLDRGAPFADVPAVLLFQTHPGFIQVCFLGWRVSPEDVDECFRLKIDRPRNTEGGPTRLYLTMHSPQAREYPGFTFAEQLTNWQERRTQWRPAALLGLYAWFRAGCPGISTDQASKLRKEMEDASRRSAQSR